MKSQAMRNFHVPLPPDLHEMLRDEVERSGEAATVLARQALREWLRARRRRRLHSEIAAYARRVSGTADDLDPDLEAAALEALGEEDER